MSGAALREILIYIDPGFLDDIGHYKNFAVNIRAEAERRGVDLWHLVNMGVSEDAAARLKLERIFQHKAILKEDYPSCAINQPEDESRAKKLLTFIKKRLAGDAQQQSVFDSIAKAFALRWDSDNYATLKSFYETLENVIKRAAKAGYKKISFYMYTSHPLYLPVFARALNSGEYASLNVRAHVGIFYLNLEFCKKGHLPEYEKMLATVENYLERYDTKERVVINADSERNIKCYEKFFHRPISLYPIPLQGRRGQALPVEMINSSGKDITIGFFGYAHVKQGYALAWNLYEEFAQDERYSHVRFVVRHNTKFTGAGLMKTAEEFRKRKKNITHLPVNMPKDEYERHLASCDIMLIPHSREDYPCQTSGTFVDCIAQKKIVVVPEDTWMADKLKEYGSGKAFMSGDSACFISAVKEIIDDFDSYRAATSRNAQVVADFHTAQTLFDTIGVGKIA